MTIIHLTRHGDVHNPEQIYYGRIPNYRLSDLGRKQAQSAGDFLRNKSISAIFASPQQRAQETAGIIKSHFTGLDIITEERLNEVYTPYDGITIDELITRNFDMYSDTQAPYEQPVDIQNRALDFMRFVCKTYPKQEVVAVSHGDVLVFTYMFAKQAELNPDAKSDLLSLGLPDEYPATASVLSFTFTEDGSSIPAVSYTRPY